MSNEQRLARKSFGEPYPCQQPWPEDCFVQCGGDGIVVSNLEESFADPVTAVGQILDIAPQPKGSYRTAFFEAFPNNPSTFIRGEGETIEAAETAAWEKYQRHAACDHPEWEKRGYTNGVGFCVKCGMSSSRHFAPWEKCKHCDYPVYPGSVCQHCELFVETAVEDGFMDMADWQKKRRDAAKHLIQQPWHCPDCDTHIKDMRFISSYDHRLTEEERDRQDRLEQAVMCHVMKGEKPFSRPDKRFTFPASVFYECKCDKLKLITDLELRDGNE